MNMTTLTNEAMFCVKFLWQQGFFDKDQDMVKALLDMHDIPEYRFVKVEKEDFFKTLATGLRELWPAGEKEVKSDRGISRFPWRDSVENLTKRLCTLWNIRDMSKYTVEDCLQVARRYLAGFERDAKYMQTLKYFIFKQRQVVEKSGRVRYQYDSKLADMLEGKTDEESVQDEWETMLTQLETANTSVLI